MACVNPNGTVTASARMMLKALTQPQTPEQAAAAAGQPLFKVRASLRELLQAGLVAQNGEQYQTTEEGLKKAEASS